MAPTHIAARQFFGDGIDNSRAPAAKRIKLRRVGEKGGEESERQAAPFAGLTVYVSRTSGNVRAAW